MALLELWSDHSGVAVVDAARTGSPAGTVHVFRADREPLPLALRSSTHAFGVADAIELGRALGRLPPRLEVYAVEGAEFGLGKSLSRAVEQAVETLAVELRRAAR